jgi:hypothetical protein
MNKKTIAVFVLVAVLLFYVKKSFSTSRDEVSLPPVIPQQTSDPYEEAPKPKLAEPKPWVFDRQTVNPKNNTRMDWSVPTTSLTQPTDWFNVENVSYWGYRVKSDCLIEYKFKDKARQNVVAKMEYKNSNHYTEGITDLWTSNKLLEIVDSTSEMRFLPLSGQPLIGPTVYRSE